MIFSINHLSRDLKIIGSIALIFGVIVIFQYGGNLKSLLLAAPQFVTAIVYFVLASGVSKKEKWVWVLGLIFITVLIISALINFFFGFLSLFLLIVGLLIPLLFFFSFLKGLKEVNSNQINLPSFFTVIIGIIIIAAFLIFGIIYQNKQSQKEKVINENLNPNLCSNETYSTEYLDYLNGEKFIDLNLESRKKFYENVSKDGNSALNGLDGLGCLEWLDLSLQDNVTDISILQNFPNLKVLLLNPNVLDVSVLSKLPKLEYLTLNESKITDFSFLKSLTNLKGLYLPNTNISDVSFLKNYKNLEELSLINTKISTSTCETLKEEFKNIRVLCP